MAKIAAAAKTATPAKAKSGCCAMRMILTCFPRTSVASLRRTVFKDETYLRGFLAASLTSLVLAHAADRGVELAAIDEDPGAVIEKHQRDHGRREPGVIGDVSV